MEIKLNLKDKNSAFINEVVIKTEHVPHIGTLIDLKSHPSVNVDRNSITTFLVLNVTSVYIDGWLKPELDCISFFNGDILREVASESNHSLEAIFARKLL